MFILISLYKQVTPEHVEECPTVQRHTWHNLLQVWAPTVRTTEKQPTQNSFKLKSIYTGPILHMFHTRIAPWPTRPAQIAQLCRNHYVHELQKKKLPKTRKNSPFATLLSPIHKHRLQDRGCGHANSLM
jgi:hypothetical protein